MTTFTVRRAKKRDTASLADCIGAAYSVYSTRITDLPPVTEGVAEAIEKHRVWVAEVERDIIGVIILIRHDNFAVLESIAVHPDYSGLGAGGVLIVSGHFDAF